MNFNFPSRFSNKHYIIAIVVIAAILRFYHIGFQSIWMDEIYTLNIADPNQSFGTMVSEIDQREGFPYLYFVIMKLLLGIFGYYPEVARVFSAIFGIASVYMIYRFGKQLFSENVGLIAALLLTFSEYCIYTSQDARPYTFYFFSILLSFYMLVTFIKNPTFKNGLFYGLSAALLLNVNFFSFINLLSQSVVIVFFAAIRPADERRNFLKYSFMAGCIAVVLFVHNYRILARMLAFKSSWIPAPTNESLSMVFKEFIGNSEMTLFLFVPLFFYFLFNLFQNENTTKYNEIINNKNVFSFVLFAPWVALFILVIFLKSHLDTSLMVSRYFISILPVFFLVFAIAITQIRNLLIRFGVTAFLVVFMLANNVAVRQYYWVPSKTQFEQAAAFVTEGNSKNEPVYTSLKYWFDHFFKYRDLKYSLAEKPSLDALVTEMAADSTNLKAFWYIDAHGRPFALSPKSQEFIDQHFYLENNYDGLDAWGRHYVLNTDAPKSVDISKYGALKQTNGDLFNANVEKFDTSTAIITASGWAYFENQPATQSRIELLFIGNGTVYRLKTQKVARPDVTTYFKSNFDLANSGFAGTIDAKQFPKGKYQLAISLVNDGTKKEGITLTNNFFEN